MTDDDVERVAKALEAKLDELSSGDYFFHKEGYEALAREAIKAFLAGQG